MTPPRQGGVVFIVPKQPSQPSDATLIAQRETPLTIGLAEEGESLLHLVRQLWPGFEGALEQVLAIGLQLQLAQHLHRLRALLDLGHQPGVEAGKKAAATVLALQNKVLAALSSAPQSAEQIAAAVAAPGDCETVYLLLEHLAANSRAQRSGPASPGGARFARMSDNA